MNWRYWTKLILIAAAFVAIGFFVAIYLFSDKETTTVVNENNQTNEATGAAPKITAKVDTKIANKEILQTKAIPTAPKPETFKLKVPYFHQQFVNSCEASSLRMALAYYGINKTDQDLVNAFGYNPKLKDVQNNIWDDPQKMFVGYVDLASSTGGYGVYGTPVARAADSFGRTAIYKTDITSQSLAAEIKAGHLVIMWGYTSLTQPPYTWNTVDGSIVKAFHGEHVRLIVGFSGSEGNPVGFYVHDPMIGAYQYWSSASLMKQFNSVPGVTNQLVIVE